MVQEHLDLAKEVQESSNDLTGMLTKCLPFGLFLNQYFEP